MTPTSAERPDRPAGSTGAGGSGGSGAGIPGAGGPHAGGSGAFDSIVIGSGINGLVAAAELARGGRRVALVERADRLGGFLASGERTAPGFVHDAFASWHPLFVSGGAYASLGAELHARGLEYANTADALTASVYRDASGRAHTAIAYRDPVTTAAGFGLAADREAYAAMLAELDARAGTVFGAFGAELRSAALAKLGWGALRSQGLGGGERLLRDAASSGRAFLRGRFTGPEVDALWSPWLLHAGLGPDHASGGVMLPVFAASMHGFGLPVVRGGAERFVAAFASLLRDHGVEILLGTEATEVVLEGGRAAGVRVSRDGVPAVLRAPEVIAGVNPRVLYGRMLPWPANAGGADPVPAAVRAGAARYRSGRAAAQIHLALERPVAWTDERLREVPLIHLSDGSASTGIACAQAEAGLIPARPTVVVGQQSLLDPSRAPEGAATLWLQLQEMPFEPRGDAGGSLDASAGWGPGLAAGLLARVLDQIEEFAPGTRASVIGSEVITPLDLSLANVNAVDGDPYGGSAELDQNLLWRPFPEAARHRTAVPGLWHIGASTHPGPGLAGGSGLLVATEILRRRPRRAAPRGDRRGR